MTDLDTLGGFLGSEEAEGYVTMYVIATAVEKTDGNGSRWIGYDFPEQPDGLHVPPEITPRVGEKVPCIVRFKPDRKEIWQKYAKILILGDTKAAAEASWPTAKAELSYLPTTVDNVRAWRKVSVEPIPKGK